MISLSDDHLVGQFSIDRLSEKCKTPSRNEDVQRALHFQQEVTSWLEDVDDLLAGLDRIVSRYNPDASFPELSKSPEDDSQHFFPMVPLFENNTVLAQSDIDKFLSYYKATLGASLELFSSKFPPDGFVSKVEAEIIFLFNHLHHLLPRWKDTITYVEMMLKKQLIQAIGKEVNAKDFEDFISFHPKKLFDPQYAPKSFSYAVRRENHYPVGMVSVEGNFGSEREPVRTTVCHIPGDTNPSIFIPVNAATSIEIQGDCYVHGWMQHEWNNQNHISSHHLVAREHQFSSFLVVLGVMGGSDKFIPKDAIILQNKDEVLIPLLTTVLPSAKGFKDAIASLSPKQKYFAEASRGMQLESYVFGVSIVYTSNQASTGMAPWFAGRVSHQGDPVDPGPDVPVC
jgi:hypothetical protein